MVWIFDWSVHSAVSVKEVLLYPVIDLMWFEYLIGLSTQLSVPRECCCFLVV